MEDNEGLGCFGVLIIIAIIWFALHNNSEKKKEEAINRTYYYESSYSGYSDPIEIENPYDYGSGHSAGYDWAEQTGGSCNGNSTSFNEGCEEYYYQLDSNSY